MDGEGEGHMSQGPADQPGRVTGTGQSDEPGHAAEYSPALHKPCNSIMIRPQSEVPMAQNAFLEALNSGRVLVADGATGSNLQARGLAQGMASEQWIIENPAAVMQPHRDFKIGR